MKRPVVHRRRLGASEDTVYPLCMTKRVPFDSTTVYDREVTCRRCLTVIESHNA